MKTEIIQKFFNVNSSTIDDIKILLKEVKSYKDEKLLNEIKNLEKELKEIKKAKKYGLVWEEKQEFFDKETVGKLPILKEIKDKNINQNNEGNNILIEGDNYHTLSVLNYTHAGKIDVIYIDPPYNTGNKSWKYNNSFVEKDDNFKHSKWLSFMSKRLKLAKNLLTEDGCLICAIDENEHATLTLLLKEIFPNYNVDSIIILHNPRGVQGKNFSYTHEYAIFVYPNNGNEYIKDIKRESVIIEELRDHGGESLRINAKNCFYPFIVNDGKIISIGNVPNDDFHPNGKNILKNDGNIEIWPIDNNGIERKWVFAKNTVINILDKLFVNTRNDGLFDILRNKDEQKPRTVWIDKKYDASTWGSKIVREITNNDFPYPKSLFTVKDCISIIKHTQNSTILDFFAGSGTTGHAVLEINREDGGNRKFILATNNENNICEEVTYERIKRVMIGYTNSKGEQVEGIGGNLSYLKTDFIDKTNVNDDLRLRMVERCSELLCLKENIWEEIPLNKGESEERVGGFFKIFERNDKYLAILFDMFYFDEFKEVLKTLNKSVSIYTFSHYKLSKTDFEELNIVFEIEQIPDPILEVYESIFGL